MSKVKMPLRDREDYPVESGVLDYSHETLSQDMWEKASDFYYLKPEVRKEILKKYYDVLEEKSLNPRQWTERLIITGGMCSYQYTNDSDIDVTVVIDEDKLKVDNLSIADMHKLVKNTLNISNLQNTDHPINYFIRTDYEIVGDGIYDIQDDRWLKRPKKISKDYEPIDTFKAVWQDMQDWFSSVDSIIGETERDIFDYEVILSRIKELSDNNKSKFKTYLSEKLKEINEDLDLLTSKYRELEEARKNLMKSDDSNELYEISKNWDIPNIKWKIAERYNYIKMIKDLKDLLSDGVEPEEVEKVKNILEKKRMSSLIKMISKKIKGLYGL